MSDTQFPPTLNSAAKQIEKAKVLGEKHLKFAVKFASLITTQGCFTKTVGVTLDNGLQVIIQFRIEPLDVEPFKRARALLGDQVPIIEDIDDEALVDSGIWPFYMSRIPGKPWAEYEDLWSDTEYIKAANSLDKVLARCFAEEDTSSVVDTVIVPNLQKIRALDSLDRQEFVPYVDKLIADAQSLKKLPSFLGHFDLNNINLLFGDDAEVTGLVDWELFFAREIVDKVFRERTIFDAMDRAFWEGLLGNTSDQIRVVLEENVEAVQTGVLIGTLRVMSIEGDEVLVNEMLLRSLPKLMSYRTPMTRGSSQAYGI